MIPGIRTTAPTLTTIWRFFVVTAVLVISVAACGSKSPSQVAGEELAAGLAAAGRGDRPAAVAHYRACLKAEPGNKICLYDLGVNAARDGQVADAENYYRTALGIDPNYTLPMFNLGILVRNRGDSSQALLLFRKYISLAPDDAEGHLQLGLTLRATGDSAGAQSEFNEALRLNPQIAIPSADAASPTASQGAGTSPSASP